MKTKKEETTTTRSVRNNYTAQFKEHTLERADNDGIPKVAHDLGLAESMPYYWWAERRQTGQPFDEQSPNNLKWLGLNGTTPTWKTRWPT